MTTPNYFEQGEVVILRGIDLSGEIEYICPVRVIEDSSQRTLLYTSVDTPLIRWQGRLVDRVTDPSVAIDLAPMKWTGTEFLSIHYPGKNYSIWAMWNMPEREFVCWYVNIEESFSRTHDGFDVTDWTLDIVIQPDLSWHWTIMSIYQTLI